MLLVNSKPLTDLLDKQKEYESGLKYLRDNFGEQLKLIRPGYPRKTKGVDPKGRDVPNMSEPSPPMRVPLAAKSFNKNGAMEIWEYCAGAPKLLPNNLWEATGTRGKSVTDNLVINLNNDPELAFFMYYKSPFIKGGELAVDDPAAAAKMKGDKARAELDLQTALYATLQDENQLRVVAQGYGLERVDKEHPDLIRERLRGVVISGEVKKRSDPSARGIKEFLDELKVTDSVRMRSLLMTAIDGGKITWTANGIAKIGERDICKVPLEAIDRKVDFVSNHLLNKANQPKLQDLLKDLVNKEYLDKITDEKTFSWLARAMSLGSNFKKAEEIKEMVYACFVTE